METRNTLSERERLELTGFYRGAVRIRSYSDEEKEMAEYIVGKMKELGFDEAYIDRTGNAVGRIGSGIPTIGFGPGQYKLAHMVDERCSLDKIHSACAFYTNLIELSAK